ncbi:MAG: OmpA family protein [Betaproteobacteria bacterium]|nr:OmpA family protein [Betaproteobacteria bacterium]
MFCALVFCASGVSQAQADPAGPLSFVRQTYLASSDFARVMPSEETLVDVQRSSQRAGIGRTFWITVEKTARPSLAELDALLNPPAPEYEVIEEACAEGYAEFPFDGSRLLASHLQDSHLEAVLGQIKEADGRVVVVGHTDSVGHDPYNCRLGMKRARAVAAWFVEHGVARERIEIGSRGKRESVADNKSETGRAQNRRAAVWIHITSEVQGGQP